MKEPYIIIAEITDEGYDRQDIEQIEGMGFGSQETFLNVMKSINPQAENNLILLPLSEFTTDWNDTDDIEKLLSIEDTFISYIYIEKL